MLSKHETKQRIKDGNHSKSKVLRKFGQPNLRILTGTSFFIRVKKKIEKKKRDEVNVELTVVYTYTAYMHVT